MKVMTWFWRKSTSVTSQMRIRDNILEEKIQGDEDGQVVLEKKSDVGYDNKYKRKVGAIGIVFEKSDKQEMEDKGGVVGGGGHGGG